MCWKEFRGNDDLSFTTGRLFFYSLEIEALVNLPGEILLFSRQGRF